MILQMSFFLVILGRSILWFSSCLKLHITFCLSMCNGYIDYRYWLFTICVIVTFASKEGVDMKLSTLRAIKLLPINWLTLQSPTDGHVNEM